MAFPSGWTRQCALVVAHGQIGSGGVTNFRVPFTAANLPTEMLSGSTNTALNGGADVRFSSDSAGSTPLACDIVACDTGAHTALIWALVPSLSDSTDTTIYVWYANSSATMPAASSTYGSNAVWKTDHIAVCHLADNPGGSAPQILDSTGNGYNGTVTGGVTSVAGVVGPSLSFDGSSGFIDFGVIPLDSLIGTGDFEGSIIFLSADGPTRGGPNTPGADLFGYDNYPTDSNNRFFLQQSYGGGVPNDGLWTLLLFGGATDHGYATVGTAIAGSPISCYPTAQEVCFGRASGVFYCHVNGSPITITDGSTGTGQATAFGTTTALFRLGKSEFTGGPYLAGIEGEFRLANVSRSAAFNLTRYNAEFSPGTFATPGTPATPTAPTGSLLLIKRRKAVA